jgi:transketolase
MRNNFIKELVKAARKDKNIYLLCGDLGYSVLEPFRDEFPDRFINIGIAEQNMMGIAAGLALCGKKVFTYSIVNFAVTRCLEQIRNDICYHDLDVTVVAIGGGVPYGTHGYTHQGVEDIAFMRNLPNIEVYSPADEIELRYCMSKIINRNGPNYLRLARGGESRVHNFEIETESPLVEIFPKRDTNIIVNGTPLKEALEAVNEMMKNGINVGLFSMPIFTTKARNNILEIAKNSSNLVTIEEHLTEGGLGSFVSEIISELPSHARLFRKGIRHKNLDKTGGQSFLRKENGIDKESIIRFVLELEK